MPSVVPQTASGYNASNSDDSEEEIYYEPTLEERLEAARSQRSDYFVAGKVISPDSQRKIATLTPLYAKEPALFFISCARWNRKVKKGGAVWWSAAGMEKADPSISKQDFSRGMPLNEERYEEWEKERLEREVVPRTSLGNPKPSASSSSSIKSKSLSLSSSRSNKLASSSSSATVQPTSGKRARTASVPTTTSAGPSKRRAISNEASLRQPSLPPPPPPPPSLVAQTIYQSASASSPKLPKATSSNGSAKSTTSIHFPVTKRSTISPQELNSKPSSSKPSTPVQPAPAPPPQSPRTFTGDTSGQSDETVKGMTPDGRSKGKEVAGRTDEVEEEEQEQERDGEEEGDVSMMEDEGTKMRGFGGWDEMLDADSSAFDLFLPPSFPNDLASSTPNAKPRNHHSSSSNSRLPPLSKHKLGELDAADAKRKRRRDKSLFSVEGSTPASTSSSNTTSIVSSVATSASLPPPASALNKPKPSRLRPSESLPPLPPLVTSLATPSTSAALSIPQHLAKPHPMGALSRASSSTGTGFSTPSEMGPPSSSLGGEEGGSQFLFGIRGSQVEVSMNEISRFMSEEEMEGGSWAS